MIVNLYCDVDSGKQMFSANNGHATPESIIVKRAIRVEFRVWFRQLVDSEWTAYIHDEGTSFDLIAKKKGVTDGDPAFESTDFTAPPDETIEYYSVPVNTNTDVLKALLKTGDEDESNDKPSVQLSLEVSWTLDGDEGAILSVPIVCQNKIKTGDEGEPVGPPSPEEKYLQIDNERFYPSIQFPATVYDDKEFGYFVPHRTLKVIGTMQNSFNAPSGGDLDFRLVIDGVINTDVLPKLSDGSEYERTIFATPIQVDAGSVIRLKIINSFDAENLTVALICKPIAP